MQRKKSNPTYSQPSLFEPEELLKEPPASDSPTPIPNSDPIPGEDRAQETVVLVDSHSLIYQVFHALPPMTSPSGIEVGAVHGFLRDIATLLNHWSPHYLICAFDASEDTFRNKLYPAYKAHREEMPDALRGQLGTIQEALKLLGIPIVSIPGYEADDILATLSVQAAERGARVLLVTSDKDCRQLIGPNVALLNLRKMELFTEKELMETWGIRPEQVVDYQSLVGDSVDNVPGVPSIGPKAAQQLLEQFGSLDELYRNLDKVSGDKKREKLIEHREDAYLSQQLVELCKETPIPCDWNQLERVPPKLTELENLFQELGFRRLSDTLLRAVGSTVSDQATDQPNQLSTGGYRLVSSESEIRALLPKLEATETIAIDTETTSTKARQTDLVGISLCWEPGQAAYIPVRSPEPTRNLPLQTLQRLLAPIFASPQKKWIGQNIKFDAIVLKAHGLPIHQIDFDTMVADYLLDAGGRNHDLADIAKRWLGVDSISIETLIGSGKNQKTMDEVPLQTIATYACEDVDIPMRILSDMRQRLHSESLESVLNELELPLIQVLAGMEYIGIAINKQRLDELRGQFQARLEALHEEVLALAGEKFNPDSPKQLAAILFDKFKLRVIKKTKTGASTDAEVLEELANEHPLPAKILEYRQLAKLLSTYVEALPALVNPKTNRVHTSYRQDIAATGRLSSVEPNLQNIPIRTPEGRSIRSAFIAGIPGWKLMTADYSQIELRVLAHCCGDENLCDAFRRDIDIHAAVAAQVHGVAIDQVTSGMRRSAKAVS